MSAESAGPASANRTCKSFCSVLKQNFAMQIKQVAFILLLWTGVVLAQPDRVILLTSVPASVHANSIVTLAIVLARRNPAWRVDLMIYPQSAVTSRIPSDIGNLNYIPVDNR